MDNPLEIPRLSRRTFLAAPVEAFAALHLVNPETESLAASMNESTYILNPTPAERKLVPITSLRTFEGGFHNGPTTHFDHLDPDDFVRRVKAAHTECMVVQAKSMWGYAYYDTKVGTRHPNLNYDLVARMIEAGHRNGLTVVAYYSGMVDVQSALKHPEWVGTNADGTPIWWGNQWPWCCHHTPYGDYAKGMYEEIFAQYDFDALFIDGSPWPRWFGEAVCCCPWCESKYLKETGESLRAATDDPRVYGRRVQWLQDCSEQFLDEIYAIVHSKRPGLPIWLNQGDPLDMSTAVLRKTSCLYIEPFSSPTGLSAGAILLRGWRMPGPQVGVFWDGYTNDPLDMDVYRAAAILLQGARPRFITDEMNMPDGRQRQQFIDWAGHLQGYVEQVEPLLHNLEPITSLGILFSETTRNHLRDEKRFVSSMVGIDFLPSLLGCTEIMTRTQYPVEFLPSADLQGSSLPEFDLIVLPETEALSDADCHALHSYVQQGGKILATYKPGLFDDHHNQRADFGLAETLGVNYVEEVTKYAGKDGPGIYMQTNGHPLSSFIGSGEVGILGLGVQPQKSFCTYVRVQGSAESILDYKPPYLVPDVSKHIFHSWNVAPPGNDRIPMAATVNRCGQGTAVYVGVPLFRRHSPDLYWIADWVRGLITRLVPDPPLQVQGSAAIHATFFRQGPKRLVVQLANSLVWTGRGNSAPVRDVEIVGRNDRFKPRSAALVWPQKQALSLTAGNKWRVRVPEVALHSIVAIELD